MDAENLGTNIIDAYMAYYAGPGARTKVDLGLIDESKIPAVVDALEPFADSADQDTLDKLSALGVARINAQRFDTEPAIHSAQAARRIIYSSVDLISFMELLGGQAGHRSRSAGRSAGRRPKRRRRRSFTAARRLSARRARHGDLLPDSTHAPPQLAPLIVSPI